MVKVSPIAPQDASLRGPTNRSSYVHVLCPTMDTGWGTEPLSTIRRISSLLGRWRISSFFSSAPPAYISAVDAEAAVARIELAGPIAVHHRFWVRAPAKSQAGRGRHCGAPSLLGLTRRPEA